MSAQPTAAEQAQLNALADALSYDIDRSAFMYALVADKPRLAKGLEAHLHEVANNARWFTENTGIAVPPPLIEDFIQSATTQGLAGIPGLATAGKWVTTNAAKVAAKIGSRAGKKATVEVVEVAGKTVGKDAAVGAAKIAIKPITTVEKEAAKTAAKQGVKGAFKQGVVKVAGKIVTPGTVAVLGTVAIGSGAWLANSIVDANRKTDLLWDTMEKCKAEVGDFEKCAEIAADLANKTQPSGAGLMEALGSILPWAAGGLVAVVALHVYLRHTERKLFGKVVHANPKRRRIR